MRRNFLRRAQKHRLIFDQVAQIGDERDKFYIFIRRQIEPRADGGAICLTRLDARQIQSIINHFELSGGNARREQIPAHGFGVDDDGVGDTENSFFDLFLRPAAHSARFALGSDLDRDSGDARRRDAENIGVKIVRVDHVDPVFTQKPDASF